MKTALVPINVRIGDFEENLRRTLAFLEQSVRAGAELVVFPELSLIGYPPQDLLHRNDFLDRAEMQLASLEKALNERSDFAGVAVVVGTALRVEGSVAGPSSRGVVNAAVFLAKGRREVRAKTLIPYYDVFHEGRYFDSAALLPESYRGPVEWNGRKLGLLVCEDSWDQQEHRARRVHHTNPAKALVEAGAEVLVNISASPFEQGKFQARRATIAAQAKSLGCPIYYVNHLGAHDEIVFDGDAFLMGPGGLLHEKPLWIEEPLVAEAGGARPAEEYDSLETLRRALVLGIRDYARKNGFKKFVLGLSGGIDSALVAALAVEAVGPENVMGLSMPGKFSSGHSIEDAEALARNLGLRLHSFPIKFLDSTFRMALKPFFEGMKDDVTEENLQARLRGLAVMAFANKFNALALATGNKSELAMGYSTLYGDMCGALMPIGDLYKTEVWALSRHLNGRKELIPESSIRKAPSAELRPNQTDQDSLPPYETLDSVLLCLIERELGVEETFDVLAQTERPVEKDLIADLQHRYRLAEYKRRQSAPVIKVSAKAFGSGRRYPITGLF